MPETCQIEVWLDSGNRATGALEFQLTADKILPGYHLDTPSVRAGQGLLEIHRLFRRQTPLNVSLGTGETKMESRRPSYNSFLLVLTGTVFVC